MEDIQGIDISADLIPDDNKLQTVSIFAQQMVDLEAELALLAAKANAKMAEYKNIAEKTLPDAMLSAGLSEFKLSNGTVVSIKDDMSVSVPKKNMPLVCGWLRDNNHGDVVKNLVEIPIAKGKGNDERVELLVKTLTALKFTFDRVESVHTGTLKALLKEQRSKGVELDLKLFGAYEWRKAEVTLPDVG